MVASNFTLVKFLEIIDHLIPKIEEPPRRGRPYVYSSKIMLKCFVVMAAKRLFSHRSLHTFLIRDDDYSKAVRKAIALDKVPNRRTFDRRFKRFGSSLSCLITHIARVLVRKGLIKIKNTAADSSLFKANGNIWHQKNIKTGILPSCGNVDVDARWGKSHTKGWVFGYGAHTVTSTGKVVIPLCAYVTPANVSDRKVFEKMAAKLPKETKFIVADNGYDDKDSRAKAKQNGIKLVTPIKICKHTRKERKKEALFFYSKQGQAIYRERAITVEPFFGQIKDIFGLEEKLPMKRLERVKSLLLTCILTFQVAVYHNLMFGLAPMRVKHLIRSM